jgi:hypothetical protein
VDKAQGRSPQLQSDLVLVAPDPHYTILKLIPRWSGPYRINRTIINEWVYEVQYHFLKSVAGIYNFSLMTNWMWTSMLWNKSNKTNGDFTCTISVDMDLKDINCTCKWNAGVWNKKLENNLKTSLQMLKKMYLRSTFSLVMLILFGEQKLRLWILYDFVCVLNFPSIFLGQRFHAFQWICQSVKTPTVLTHKEVRADLVK